MVRLPNMIMKMAIGSDSKCHLTEAIVAYLQSKGLELIHCGALADREADYVDSAREVAELVAGGTCEQGLLFCDTGTGATIIANKVPGVRAALCVDAYSAKIARLVSWSAPQPHSVPKVIVPRHNELTRKPLRPSSR